MDENAHASDPEPRPARAGLIGKVLLWAIGIPLLIIIFAIAAFTRGVFSFGSSDHRADHRQPDQPAGSGRSWER
jgi:hypothetical protein